MIDAFLLIGQSNMAGRGELGALPPLMSPNVLMFRDGAWISAAEPVHRDRPFAGEGLSIAFGDAVQRATGRAVGLIPCAMGGSALSEWQEGMPLFETAVAVTKAAEAESARLCGILWHQGEADGLHRHLAETYAMRLCAMLRAFAARLGAPNLPVVLGELGRYLSVNGHSPYAALVNRQLRRVAAARPACALVSSAGLTDKGDALHFDAVSLRVFGGRYADAYLKTAGPSAVTPKAASSESEQ